MPALLPSDLAGGAAELPFGVGEMATKRTTDWPALAMMTFLPVSTFSMRRERWVRHGGC